MTELLIATRNAHKLAEMRSILGDEFRYVTLNEFPAAPAVVEDADSFAGNATKKAVELARWVSSGPMSVGVGQSGDCFVMADDSGLEVDVLNGAPGVHSARFAGLDSGQKGNSPTADNNAKLIRLLAGVPMESRRARFRCVIALTPVRAERVEGGSSVCYTDKFAVQTETFEGICEGRIGFEPRGTNGFGYDPLFVPDGFNQTFAELGEDVKNRLSHRARALSKLKERLKAIAHR